MLWYLLWHLNDCFYFYIYLDNSTVLISPIWYHIAHNMKQGKNYQLFATILTLILKLKLTCLNLNERPQERDRTTHLRWDISTDWQTKSDPLSANSNRFTLKGHWLTAHVSDTHLEWARMNQWNKRKIRDDYSWTTPIDKRWAGPRNPLQVDND